MARKRLRITVKNKGVERQLFTVGETSAGDLNIMVSGAGLTTLAGPPERMAGRTKISIHSSPNSDGFTIKQSNEMADGLLVTRAVVLTGSKESGFFCPLFARMCQRLDREEFDVGGKASDQRICISEFDPDQTTLAYVVIAMHGLIPPTPQDPLTGHPAGLIHYGKFSLMVVPYLSPAPTPGTGLVVEWVRSVELGGEPASFAQPQHIEPPDLAEVKAWQSFALGCFSAFNHRPEGSSPDPQK